MINRYDIAYGLGMGVSAPFWLIKPSARRKVLSALRNRMGRSAGSTPRDLAKPAVLIHAVSLGEINATRSIVQSLRQADGELHVIISTTTDAGHERAVQLYGGQPGLTVIRYPLDFSRAVSRVLDSLRPDLVVLMELEVWPNFLRQCQARNIPVALVNGRLTPTSFSRYRWIKPVAASMFRRLALVCVQDETYGRRFIELGVDPGKIRVTGTMKFDTAEVAERIAGDDELATALGLYPGVEPIWVCGSTGPGEEAIILRAYRRLLERHSRLRLALIPRHPYRFDEVAALIEQSKFKCIRRSQSVPAASATLPSSAPSGPSQPSSPTADPAVIPPQSPITPSSFSIPPVILGDTMGELRKFYSLADVVFVGRSLVDLGSRQHGSDMIEPAALAKPLITGPFTGNFTEVMNRLRDAEAVMEVPDEQTLTQTLSVLLFSPEQSTSMGRRAQQVVIHEKGATTRHTGLILELLRAREGGEVK